MPFREKIAWASLIAHLVVFGWYFSVFAPSWAERAAADDRGLGRMVLAVVALVALSIALAIALAVSSPKGDVAARIDEREKLIRLRAANLTAGVVTAGVLLVMSMLMLGWNAVLGANLLLLVLVTGEVVKAAAQIVQFRTSL